MIVCETDFDPTADAKELFHDWLENFDAVADEDSYAEAVDLMRVGWTTIRDAEMTEH